MISHRRELAGVGVCWYHTSPHSSFPLSPKKRRDERDGSAPEV
jgi:hypothetical protein